MIDLKNRSREQRVYQYARDVSAGPVRPQPMTVVRGKFNPKTGETNLVEKPVTLGGVLTLHPGAELKGLPDTLLDHPALQRDIAARLVIVKKYSNPVRTASAVKVEPAPVATTKPKKASKKG